MVARPRYTPPTAVPLIRGLSADAQADLQAWLLRQLGQIGEDLATVQVDDAPTIIESERIDVSAGSQRRVSPGQTGMVAILEAPSPANSGRTITLIIEKPAGDLTVVASPHVGPDGKVARTLINDAAQATFTRPGVVQFRSNGIDSWKTQAEVPAETEQSEDQDTLIAALDAGYHLQAAHTSLPNARVATTSTEIEVDNSATGQVGWNLRDGSVALTRLADITGPALLGLETGTGAPEPLTGAEAGQLIKRANDISVTITTDQDDWAPTGIATASVIFVTTSGNVVTITGIDGSSLDELDGTFFFITVSSSTGRLQFSNNSASSVSGNRLLCPISGGNTFGIGPQEWAIVLRNGILWYVMPCAPLLTGPQLGLRIRYTGEISPTIASNTNDWAPTGLSTAYSIKAALTGSRTLTGIDSSVFVDAAAGNTGDGVQLLLKNNDASDSLLLSNNSISSASGNRFNAGTPAINVTLDPGWTAHLTQESGFWVPRVFFGPVPDDSMLVNISGATNIARFRGLSSMVADGLDWDATNHVWVVDVTDLVDNVTITEVATNNIQRAALNGAIAASAGSNETTFAGIRDNGSAENDRTNLNFVSSTTVTLAVTDDSGGDELEITASVPNNAITNAELTNMDGRTIKANPTTSSGDPQDFLLNANSFPAVIGGEIVAHPFATLAGDGLAYASGVMSVDEGFAFTWTGVHTFDSSLVANGTTVFTGRVRLGGVGTTAIGGNRSGLDTATLNVIRFTGASVLLHGMVANSDNQVVLIANASSTDLTIIKESGTEGTAANRFAGTSSSVIVPAGDAAFAWYDTASSRWRAVRAIA